MAAFEIRPRRATELVDASFQLLRRFYPQFLTVTAIAMAPSVFIQIYFRQSLGSPQTLAASGATIASGFLSALGAAIADAVLVVAASEGYLDGEVDLAEALSLGASKLGSVFLTSFARYFIVFGALFLIAIVGGVVAAIASGASPVLIGVVAVILVPFVIWLTLYLGLRTFAAIPAVLLEGKGAFEAIGRSWRLAKDSTLHVFCSLGLAWLLYFVFVMIATAVGMRWLSMGLTRILSTLLIIPIYPLLAVVSTLVYYDLRIRKEGFDLELMSRDIGSASSPSAPPVPTA